MGVLFYVTVMAFMKLYISDSALSTGRWDIIIHLVGKAVLVLFI